MNDINSIIKKCYYALPSLSGGYKKFSKLLEQVNKSLVKEDIGTITDSYLKQCILKINPKARFESEYRLEGNSLLAVRIVFPDNVPKKGISGFGRIKHFEDAQYCEELNSILGEKK